MNFVMRPRFLTGRENNGDPGGSKGGGRGCGTIGEDAGLDCKFMSMDRTPVGAFIFKSSNKEDLFV